MSDSVCRVLVTGARGFIGKNIVVRLGELSGYRVKSFVRGDDSNSLGALVAAADAIIHLAGENRPADESQYAEVNAGLTARLCDAVAQEAQANGRKVPLLFASSAQVDKDNAYGRSKLAAEQKVAALADTTGNPCVVYRLPGVFGKWCKPHYNSVVATFCHQLARDLPITINDPSAMIKLAYVDDVVSELISALKSSAPGLKHRAVEPVYEITLGALASQIKAFSDCRSTLQTERVGTGLVRALYATYVSYLPNEKFEYEVPQHSDPRGTFVEMLKTPDSGQFSYFTAHPGVTRGGHYHHSKTEKFLVIKGEALFRFRHLLTNEIQEIRASGGNPKVVDTIPGWVHDITNIGDEEMVVMLWANENFDRDSPDTVTSKV